MRQGLDASCSLGTLALSLAVNEDRRGLRGKMEFIVISRGPGTTTKCVCLVMSGYDAIKSARESKPSTPSVSYAPLNRVVYRCHIPWYRRISLALPWAMPLELKLPHSMIRRGMN